MLRHIYREEILIKAPREIVWQILSDFELYPDWHPFTPSVNTDNVVGGIIRQDVNMFEGKKPVKFKGRISKWEEGVQMAWTMSYWPFIWAERFQLLEDMPDGQTRYRTEDMNAGLLNPIVKRIYGKAIYRGFRLTAIALKTRVENQ